MEGFIRLEEYEPENEPGEDESEARGAHASDGEGRGETEGLRSLSARSRRVFPASA